MGETVLFNSKLDAFYLGMPDGLEASMSVD